MSSKLESFAAQLQARNVDITLVADLALMSIWWEASGLTCRGAIRS
jgi:hypothetical protein